MKIFSMRWVAAATVYAAAVLLAACGTPTGTCGACTGCCDATGACRPGTAQSACGKGGETCNACAANEMCSANVCSGGSAGGGAAGGGAAGGGAAGGGAGGGSAGGGSATADAVVNEICARGGDEYVELFNPGSAPKDLSGFGLVDTATDGGPYLSRALRFPSGTTLAANGFLLTVIGRSSAGASTNCLDAGASSCFEATWSISNSNGERVWLVDSNDAVVHTADYPPSGHDAGFSYGRLPDGTGAFTQTRRTPGVANAAP